MIYSRTSEYALRSLAFMAQKKSGRAADVREVSQATGIPAPYVAKVLQGLARANILSSKKGRGGGFAFRRGPSKTTLWQVVRATDDAATSALSNCVMGLKQCGQASPCPLHEVWSEATTRLKAKLRRTTVTDMAGLPGRFARSGRARRTLSVQMRSIFGHGGRPSSRPVGGRGGGPLSRPIGGRGGGPAPRRRGH